MARQTMLSAYVADHALLVANKIVPTGDPDYLPQIVARQREAADRYVRAGKLILILAAIAATFMAGQSLPEVAGITIPNIPAKLEVLTFLIGFAYLRLNQAIIEWSVVSRIVAGFVATRYGQGAPSHAILHLDSSGVPGELADHGFIPDPRPGRAVGAARTFRNTIGGIFLFGTQAVALGSFVLISCKIPWFRDLYASLAAILGLVVAGLSLAYTVSVALLPRSQRPKGSAA